MSYFCSPLENLSAIEGALCRFRPPVFKASSLQKNLNPQKVDNHTNSWAQIAHSVVLNTLQEMDPYIKHSHILSHPFSVLSPHPPPRHTHSTQPQRSIAQTEGTLSQLKVTKRQVICQAVPELNPGTGFWG